MDTPPPSEPSWPTLVQRARDESAPDVDVRAALRQQILSEGKFQPSAPVSPGILDDVLALVRGLRGLSSIAALTLTVMAFGWLMSDALGEINLVVQLQTQLLAGL
ncbi:MAG: hypothetical protein CFE26_17945 [Verrucomicrobiales bacterium VVV1]|nr:MAG: hypothetical protein CFE26_17945 [Verrucomicrobiales bacterium VVV1]